LFLTEINRLVEQIFLKVLVTISALTIDYDYKLKSALQSMGIIGAFQNKPTQFDNLTVDKQNHKSFNAVYVSNAKHKAISRYD
jgi:serine protease inhibitor